MENPSMVYKICREKDGKFFSMMPLCDWAEREYKLYKITRAKREMAKLGYDILAFDRKIRLKEIALYVLANSGGDSDCSSMVILLCEASGIRKLLPDRRSEFIIRTTWLDREGIPNPIPNPRSLEEFKKGRDLTWLSLWWDRTIMCKSIRPIKVLKRFRFSIAGVIKND